MVAPEGAGNWRPPSETGLPARSLSEVSPEKPLIVRDVLSATDESMLPEKVRTLLPLLPELKPSDPHEVLS